MKLSNFKLIEIKLPTYATGCKAFIANVDVETGILWWKKTERKRIAREVFSSYWIFMDNGEFTPGLQAENLARVWRIETGQEV